MLGSRRAVVAVLAGAVIVLVGAVLLARGSRGGAPARAHTTAIAPVAHPASAPPVGHPEAAHTATYGGIPSWLPKPKVRVGRIVQASAAHPWLAIEGDTVSVHLAGGRTTATAVGPAVPEEGQFPVPRTTPCSFNVTLTDVSGAVPLSPSAFTIVDEQGLLHHPRVTVTGGGALPQRVGHGRSISLTISDVLPTGSGTLQWAPDTAKPIVSWDFDVEID